MMLLYLGNLLRTRRKDSCGSGGAKGYNSVAPYLNSGFQRGMMNATMSVPTSVLGSGLNKAITGRR